jgi:hypothetical protein
VPALAQPTQVSALCGLHPQQNNAQFNALFVVVDVLAGGSISSFSRANAGTKLHGSTHGSTNV